MNVNISARVESVVDPEMFLLNGRRQERLVGLNKGKNLRMGNSLSSVWIILSVISSLAIFLCVSLFLTVVLYLQHCHIILTLKIKIYLPLCLRSFSLEFYKWHHFPFLRFPLCKTRDLRLKSLILLISRLTLLHSTLTANRMQLCSG